MYGSWATGYLAESLTASRWSNKRALVRRQEIQEPVRLDACGWWWQSMLPMWELATQPPPGTAGLET